MRDDLLAALLGCKKEEVSTFDHTKYGFGEIVESLKTAGTYPSLTEIAKAVFEKGRKDMAEMAKCERDWMKGELDDYDGSAYRDDPEYREDLETEYETLLKLDPEKDMSWAYDEESGMHVFLENLRAYREIMPGELEQAEWNMGFVFEQA